MTVLELLAWLDQRGIQIDRRGDRLLVRSPHGSINDDARQLLRENKAALLAEIDRRGVDAPVSFGQQQIWLIDQVEGGGHAYNATVVLRVHGSIHDAALDKAFTGLAERNEVLRTGLVEHRGELRQRTRPPGPVTVDKVELGDLSAKTAQARIREIAEESATARFDLANDVLVRATRIRMHNADTVLVLTMHHVAGDGLSMGLLYTEIAELYDAAVAGREPDLAPPPGQYSDYARYQREAVVEHAAVNTSFWSRYLNGAPTAALPLDRARPAQRTFTGDCVRFRLDADLVVRLRSLASSHGTTLFVVLLGVLAELLARHGGQDDVVIATPIVDRPERRFEQMIGYFLNTVVIRCDLSGSPAFNDVVDRVRDSTLEALSHASTPFEQVVRAAGSLRDGSGNPVYQVMLALQTGRRARPRLAGQQVEEIRYDPPTARHDLTIMLDEDADGLVGRLEYSTEVFDRETANLLAARLVRLADAVTADPSRPTAADVFADEAEETGIADSEAALQIRIVDSDGVRVPSGVVGQLILDDGIRPAQELGQARWLPRGGVEVLRGTEKTGSTAADCPKAVPSDLPVAPATTSDLVTEIWADVLGRRPDSDDDFFALGGTSMTLMEVNWQLRRRAGVDVPLAELLADPTVDRMAALVIRHQQGDGADGQVAGWSRTELPLRGPGHLWNVAAVSPTEVWVAGVHEIAGIGEPTRSVVLRQGSDGWHEVAHPDLEKVFGIAIAPSGAIWLSGRQGLLRFDGDRFQRVEGKAPRYDCASITRIGEQLWTIVRPDDTPGAQTYVAAGGEDGDWQTLPLPLPCDATTRFGCLAGTSEDDVWAAVVVDGNHTYRESWLAHWKDGSWHEVVPPPLGRAEVEIMRIVARSTEDVWVLGARLSADGRRSVMVHWNGLEWTEAALPDAHRGRITSLTVAADGTLWAAGGGGGDPGVVLHSSDGGLHWESDIPPASVLLGDVVALPDTGGLMIGGAADDGMALFHRNELG